LSRQFLISSIYHDTGGHALPAALAVALGRPTQDSAIPPGLGERRDEKWLQDWIFMELYAYFRRKASLVQYCEDGSFTYSHFDRMFMIDKGKRPMNPPRVQRTDTLFETASKKEKPENLLQRLNL
jgi:hypothetical protein